MTPEQLARQKIDAQLVACGWTVQDYQSVDFSVGRGIALREVPLKTGPCDYLVPMKITNKQAMNASHRNLEIK